MIGTRIPTGKRIINNPSFPPLNPTDFSEANANNLMFLWDNMGTGEYLEDAAILFRHLRNLLAQEQATPNLTLNVNPGIGWFAQNSYVNYAGGASPSFTAPAANPRRDILTLRNDGTLHVIMGAEAASPVAPSIPSTDIPLCQVFSRVGQTSIHDNDTQVAGQGYVEVDLRPFTQLAIGASAMPKLGIVARYDKLNQGGGTVDLVPLITGAGRIRSISFEKTGGGALTGAGPTIDVIIDGTTYTYNAASPLSQVAELAFAVGGTTMYHARFTNAAAPQPATNEDLGFFKTSLRIAVASNGSFNMDFHAVIEKE